MRCISASNVAARLALAARPARSARCVAPIAPLAAASADFLSGVRVASRPRAFAVVRRSGKSAATTNVAVSPEQKGASAGTKDVRVRFAPSPTGNLHVGGARTALFNWLYARKLGGKFIIRVEDTDTERSTRASEDAMIRDLKWLGLDWDEGPTNGGPHAPYRQSERAQIYIDLAQKLVKEGKAYPCFCTEAELEAMKTEAEAKKLPPKYTGKWAKASQAEVDAMLATGAKPVYRFRVPENRVVTIQDRIRGEVSWNTDAVGDFVLVRSNGLPVYNFCVAVDDSLMGITHVLRAEEHLPNTLRQVLVYEALGYPTPEFAHMSLILAPDRSKLSKRHGATSVGDFREQGYLPQAMVNYLSLLGWNDGTEKEVYTIQELIEAFSIDRITKSPAVFDKVKLNWMNGQHLRALPAPEQLRILGDFLVGAGIVSAASGPFVEKAVAVCAEKCELAADVARDLKLILAYQLEETAADPKGQEIMKEAGFASVAKAVVEAHASGALQKAVDGGHDGWKEWTKELGKALKLKGKGLFMPLRVALTGSMIGPDVGDQLALVGMAKGNVKDESLVVPLDKRIELLKKHVPSA